MSSAGAKFRSLRGSTAAKNAPPPTVYTQPAFAGKKPTFAPPPVRRVSAATPVPAAPEPEEDAQPEPGEEEAAGEWAEALYDYTSEVRLLFSFLGGTDSRAAIFEGRDRSKFTSGGEGMGDRTDFDRLVRIFEVIGPTSWNIHIVVS